MHIVYRGLKEVKGDNVAGTGLTWKRGEIHEINDEAKAAKLLEHPLIWADADKQYEMIPEPKVIPPSPRVQFAPVKSDTPFWDPVILTTSPETFEKLQKKELVAVFVGAEDVDAFEDWKLERATRPADLTVPRETGPTPKSKDTKPGLDTKQGVLENAKRVA
jgi:hypothetical protein